MHNTSLQVDLTKADGQVPVEEENQCSTFFSAPFRLFQFKRMPFGLPCMMDKLFEDVYHVH